jgi:transposase-like protein
MADDQKGEPMDPQSVFCPNSACPARGQVGRGNMGIHSQRERRYRCSLCGQTFSERVGTPFYRCRTAPERITLVLTLVAHGCPPGAIEAAFGVQARTVRDWLQAAGRHCQQVHQHQVLPQELGQVQADELRVKLQGQVVWLGMALAVPSRLWLGAVVSATRDTPLLRGIAAWVRAWSLPGPLLIAVDGLAGYVTAFRQAFRSPQPSGKGGRPPLIPWEGIVIGQVIKQYQRRRVVGVTRCLAQGSEREAATLLAETQGGGVLNTAFIERLNATFRSRLSVLVRRTRRLGRCPARLEAAVYLLGCVYNFCSVHTSLPLGGQPATPAMLAGLTDHCWAVEELLWYQVPPPPWQPPKRRGYRSRAELALLERWVW